MSERWKGDLDAWITREEPDYEEREPEKRIITTHVYPPIPDRRFDWCAYREGTEEAGQYGYGTTEQAAIADLLKLEDEQ